MLSSKKIFIISITVFFLFTAFSGIMYYYSVRDESTKNSLTSEDNSKQMSQEKENEIIPEPKENLSNNINENQIPPIPLDNACETLLVHESLIEREKLLLMIRNDLSSGGKAKYIAQTYQGNEPLDEDACAIYIAFLLDKQDSCLADAPREARPHTLNKDTKCEMRYETLEQNIETALQQMFGFSEIYPKITILNVFEWLSF
ncbi:MAG: hypothetical protein IPN70_00670 [Candidatus Moraniibacteriota bacterium]|nr:MAG: hypothetical protein IPN70_00670 [Candidatus Moranbacteria bacterium]